MSCRFLEFWRKMYLDYSKVSVYLQSSSSHLLFFVFCSADPLPPARLEVNKEKSTSTSLHVWWAPSSGKVTWYEVQLLDDNQKTQGAQIQERTSQNEYTFFNLTAGSKYKIAVTAVSGDKRSSTIYANGSTGKTCLRIVAYLIVYDSFEIILHSGNGSKNAPRSTINR